ncbi:MAPEG family protein [Sphingomonas arenae]|uniref:MAPEG family protein n=1 Tax=Sphingomonas arenae TaxID=2812555 RepID=UPI001967F542|nr:MAPEG family protein [Sphingomonas arenae]
MPPSPLLGPVVALVAWSLVMMVWMALTRLPAMKKAGIGLNRRGGRGANLEGVIPDEVNWKAHNYQHLMEQPTIFYAIVLSLILMGFDHPINVWLAWAYVALRVAHSLVQATINVVAVRFTLFALSSLCLVSLTVHAGLRLWH